MKIRICECCGSTVFDGTPREKLMALLRLEASQDGIELSVLLGRSKEKEVSHCRQKCFHMMREMGYSCSAIGRLFGRDHTTVLSGIKQYQRRQLYLKERLERKMAGEQAKQAAQPCQV